MKWLDVVDHRSSARNYRSLRIEDQLNMILSRANRHTRIPIRCSVLQFNEVRQGGVKFSRTVEANDIGFLDESDGRDKWKREKRTDVLNIR